MTKKKVQIGACNTYRNSDAVKSVLEIVHVTAYSRKSINLKLHTVCQMLMTGNGSVYKRTTSRRHVEKCFVTKYMVHVAKYMEENTRYVKLKMKCMNIFVIMYGNVYGGCYLR